MDKLTVKQLARWNKGYVNPGICGEHEAGYNEGWNQSQGFPSPQNRNILREIAVARDGLMRCKGVTMAEYRHYAAKGC